MNGITDGLKELLEGFAGGFDDSFAFWLSRDKDGDVRFEIIDRAGGTADVEFLDKSLDIPEVVNYLRSTYDNPVEIYE